MKTWRTVLLGGVLLPLFAGCSGEGVSPSGQPLGPSDPGLAMTNVDALLKVDVIEFIPSDPTGLLELTISLNRGLFRAAAALDESTLEIHATLQLSNAAGQTRYFQITQSLALTKPLQPPSEGLVVIAITIPWDQKDSNGNLFTGATMVEYSIQLQFVAGGRLQTLAHTTGSMFIEQDN